MITFSPHAHQRMAIRHISENMVTSAIYQPDKKEMGYLDRQIVYKKVDHRFIKVVYVIENNIYHVITVIWKSKI